MKLRALILLAFCSNFTIISAMEQKKQKEQQKPVWVPAVHESFHAQQKTWEKTLTYVFVSFRGDFDALSTREAINASKKDVILFTTTTIFNALLKRFLRYPWAFWESHFVYRCCYTLKVQSATFYVQANDIYILIPKKVAAALLDKENIEELSADQLKVLGLDLTPKETETFKLEVKAVHGYEDLPEKIDTGIIARFAQKVKYLITRLPISDQIAEKSASNTLMTVLCNEKNSKMFKSFFWSGHGVPSYFWGGAIAGLSPECARSLFNHLRGSLFKYMLWRRLETFFAQSGNAYS